MDSPRRNIRCEISYQGCLYEAEVRLGKQPARVSDKIPQAGQVQTSGHSSGNEVRLQLPGQLRDRNFRAVYVRHHNRSPAEICARRDLYEYQKLGRPNRGKKCGELMWKRTQAGFVVGVPIVPEFENTYPQLV